ncbi:MAG: CotH kinase family protein [Bacillota bacterium]|nr:CotH kinase family protein [Bacillota bacterium]
MTNNRIILLSLVMVIFTALFVFAYTAFGTGKVTVYGDEYVSRYFQRDEVMDVNIGISEADWENMMENPMAEKFHPATVTVNGDIYPSVRIRTKGNSSLMSVARSDSNRYSFKINFDSLVKNQTMAGLTQLNLNNGFSDPSYMREYLSYQIFEEMGVAVPAFAFAAVYVNGDYFGLYLAVESILEPYLERNFGNITGDLYKSVGNTLRYNGTNPADYTGLEVKSDRKNADWSRLIRMLDALNNDGDLEKYLDVDAALRYIAVSTALANFDSYQGRMGHNYYLYEQNGVFTILPWDLNMSFGGFSFGGDATSVYIDEPTQGALAERPLIASLFANEEYLETYHGYLEEIATEFLSSSYLEDETARLFELISPYVRTDPTAFYTYEQFERSISGTIAGGAMGDENQAEVVPNIPEANNVSGNQGFRMGGVQGFGGNVPGILELAAAMSELIQNQLSGELPSRNNGSGMGGMGGGGVRNIDGGRIPPQQRPGENTERPAWDGGGRQPGGMVIPEGLDIAAMETLRQEILQAGGLNDELREKAGELGIPENIAEMMAGFPDGGGMSRGIWPGGDPGGNPRFGMGTGQPQAIDKAALTLLLVSGAAIIAGIIMLFFFKRRKYIKA